MKLNIKQIYYDKSQLSGIDPSLDPYDNTENPFPEQREFYLFEKMFKSPEFENSDLFGMLSHKFNLKSKISGDVFKKWILSNPGYDVYFLNPFPQDSYLFFNIWDQGSYYHPGLKSISQELCDFLSLDFSIFEYPRSKKEEVCYCNFWLVRNNFGKITWNLQYPFQIS